MPRCSCTLCLRESQSNSPVCIPKPQIPILVDLSVEQGPPAEQRETKGASRTLSPHVAAANECEPVVALKPEVTTPVAAKTVNEATTTTFNRNVVPVAVAASTSAMVAGTAPTTTGPGGQGMRNIAAEKSLGAGNASRGESKESQQTRYLKEHFAYIRERIAGNLRYPGKARKMGWNGKLAVEFVILESGTVEHIRIAKSSGIALLDSDAEDTVRRSAPFPKPPVSARLIIPVEYVLQ